MPPAGTNGGVGSGWLVFEGLWGCLTSGVFCICCCCICCLLLLPQGKSKASGCFREGLDEFWECSNKQRDVSRRSITRFVPVLLPAPRNATLDCPPPARKNSRIPHAKGFYICPLLSPSPSPICCRRTSSGFLEHQRPARLPLERQAWCRRLPPSESKLGAYPDVPLRFI